MESIILLHGAIGTKSLLINLANELEKHFEVHLLDFSGHGTSQTDKDFSIELFSNDLLKYVKQFPDKKFHIFGYSMGGYVALYSELYHPGTLLSVYTYGKNLNGIKMARKKKTKC